LKGALVMLVLVSCAHRDELAAIEAVVDADLAYKKDIADHLADRRREMDALDERLRALLDGHPLPQGDAGVHSPPLTVTALTVTLPPASIFEGPEQKKARARIEEKIRRAHQLEILLGEVNAIDARRAEIEEKLKQVR
jgi:hypothetical protein